MITLLKKHIIPATGILFLVLLLSMPSISFAADTPDLMTLEVAGAAKIQKNNIAQGRESAVLNSLVSAVNMMVAELLPIETMVGNFQALHENVYTRTSSFIQDYKVLTESVSGLRYMVLVRATVSKERVTKKLTDMGLMLGRHSFPKVLFMISEKNVEDLFPQHWWGEDLVFSKTISEITLTDIFLNKGFLIAGHNNVVEPVRYNVSITNGEAIDLGRRLKADVVVVGNASAVIAPNTMGAFVKTFTGNVSARAIGVKTGDLFASVAESANATHEQELTGGRQAIEGAVRLAGESLSLQLAKAWQMKDARSARLELVVEGTGGNIASFVKFRGALSDLSGVNEIKLKELMSDAAVIGVDFQGSARALADALMLKTFTTFGINIYEISPKGLKIRLIHND